MTNCLRHWWHGSSTWVWHAWQGPRQDVAHLGCSAFRCSLHGVPVFVCGIYRHSMLCACAYARLLSTASGFVFISRVCVCVSHTVLIFNLQGLLGAFTSPSIPWKAGGTKSNFISRLDLRWCRFTSLFCLQLLWLGQWWPAGKGRFFSVRHELQCGIKTSLFGSFKCKMMHIAVLPSKDGRAFPHNLHKALCTWSSGPRLSSHVDLCQSLRGERQITCLAQKAAKFWCGHVCVLRCQIVWRIFIGPGASSRKRTAADAEMEDQQQGTAIVFF